MTTALALSSLKQVKPWSDEWMVHVKVDHCWKSGNKQYGESLEFIIVDEEGTHMHGSAKREQLSKFQRTLTSGGWKVLRYFTVINATGQYRPTKHVYKINLIDLTEIEEIAPLSTSTRLTLTCFEAIKNENYNMNFLVDTIGQVINVGTLDTLEVNNRSTKKIDFQLRDTSDSRLRCTLWGNFADVLYNASLEAGENQLVCIIKYAKVKKYNGEHFISNSFDASVLLFDDDIEEIKEFKNNLPRDGLLLTLMDAKPKIESQMVVKEEFLQFPTKIISEIIDTNEVSKCRLICTIYAIDTDYSWYYFNCRACSAKVFKKLIPNNPTKKKAWYCGGCSSFVKSLIPRFKLHLKVKDDSGEMKCLLFDSHAARVVSHSASKILKGSIEEIKDPTNLPSELINIVGSTWQFLISVENENFKGGNETYKGMKVWSQTQMLTDVSLSNSENYLSIGLEQMPLRITNSEEISDHSSMDSSTPLSKRKEASSGDAPEEFSTTLNKKTCSRVIKLEDDDKKKKD